MGGRARDGRGRGRAGETALGRVDRPALGCAVIVRGSFLVLLARGLVYPADKSEAHGNDMLLGFICTNHRLLSHRPFHWAYRPRQLRLEKLVAKCKCISIKSLKRPAELHQAADAVPLSCCPMICVFAGNKQHLNILMSLVSHLVKALGGPQQHIQSSQYRPGQSSSATRVRHLNHFLFDHGLDNVNMFRIVR